MASMASTNTSIKLSLTSCTRSERLWRDQIVQQFRQHRTLDSPETAAELVQYARDQAELIKAIQFQRELLLSYNIGVEQDVAQKDVRERTAARLPLTEGSHPVRVGLAQLLGHTQQ
ncbi:hypothetical protein WJX74_007807 [Apatococcus lobatus]|uniref:Uncharacterized protein n=1 Tax=Apatococcus lobatus TaxID=904363 RepID=A0AAW1RW97_9CHLO